LEIKRNSCLSFSVAELLLTYIQEVTNSNLGGDMTILSEVSYDFPQSLQINAAVMP
jgi:hypothetical protein